MPLSVDTTKPAGRRGRAGRRRRPDQRRLGRRRGRRARPARGRRARVPLVVMHNRAEPRYDDLHRGGRRRPRSAALERAVRLGVALGRPDRRSRASGSARRPSRTWRWCASSAPSAPWAGPILLGTSRKSTLGRVLDLPVGGAARGDPGHHRARRSPPASTSSASTTSGPTFARPGSATPSFARTGGPMPPKEAPAERPDRPGQHALPGSPRLLRPRAAHAPAVRGRRRARAQPPAGRRRRRPRPSRSTTGRSTRPSGRSSNRPRSGCSRPWPRRSATSSWRTSRSTEVGVRVRKPKVQLERPARLRRRRDLATPFRRRAPQLTGRPAAG